MTEFTIPMKLTSLMNAREHWAVKAKRAKYQSAEASVMCRIHNVKCDKNARYVVEITRLGPRKLDDDNLAASAKHVRDGIARYIGIDDGSEQYVWKYSQEKSKEYGVRVRIEIVKTRGGMG